MLFPGPVNGLSFLDHTNDKLIGIDDSGVVLEFSSKSTGDVAGPSSGRGVRLTVTRQLDENLKERRKVKFLSTQFSKDGWILLRVWRRHGVGLDVYRLGDTVQHVSIDFDIHLILTKARALDNDLAVNLSRAHSLISSFDVSLCRSFTRAFDLALALASTWASEIAQALLYFLETKIDSGIDPAASISKFMETTGFFEDPVLSENGRHVLLTYGLLSRGIVRTAVYDIESLPPKRSREPILFPHARGFWGKGGEYVMLWKDEYSDRPMLEVCSTKELKGEFKGYRRRLEQGLVEWNAEMLEGRDVCVAIHTISDSGKQRIQLWDCILDVIRCDVGLETRPRRDIESVSASNEQSAKEVVQAVVQPTSPAEVIKRARRDAHPMFCISKDRAWATVFSWSLHTCAVCSLSSSLTVFDFDIPEDITFEPFRIQNRAMFDPSGDRLLLLGGANIYAVSSPGSLSFCHRNYERLDYLTVDSRDVSSHLMDRFAQLPSEALVNIVSSSMRSSKLRIHCIGRPMEISSVTDIALSHAGRQMAMIANEDSHSVVLTGDKIQFRDALASRSEWNVNFVSRCIEEKGTEKVYIYFDDRGNESAVVLHLGSRNIASFFNLNDRSSEVVDIGSQRIHEITQTEDRQRLLMLDDCGVLVVDLWKRKVIEHINYNVDLSPIAFKRRRRQLLARWFPQVMGMPAKRISDDGKTVLIAWDIKNKKSIVVKPYTSNEECKDMFAKAGRSLSDHCLLSHNAEVTLFVDVDALSQGRLIIGVFNESCKTKIPQQ